MQIGSVNTLFGSGHVVQRPSVLPISKASALRSDTTPFDPSPFRALMRETIRLREQIGEIRHSFRVFARRGVGQVGGVITVASANPLGLDPTETSTTLQSTQEVNTISTSYTPFGPSFTGSSTSLPTLAGIYTGNEDDVYTFTVTKGGAVGGNKKLQIKVTDQNGKNVDVINIPVGTPADTPFTLSSGLTLSLSAGNVSKNDAFQVSVFATTGSTVNPDNPFDGTRNERPNFDPGLGVTNGSFEVNGVTISVSAGDSINSVLTTINNSTANVTAVFNAASETIELTSDIVGSSGQIVLENDTSGFLTATKLDGAVALPGRDSDVYSAIGSVGALSQINNGQFSINGISVSVDTAVDSLNDVISRINQTVPEILASYDIAGDVFRIQAQPNSILELDNGSSGFFSALGIEAKTYEVRSKTGQVSSVSRETVIKHLKRLTKSINKLSLVAARPQNQAVGSTTLQRLWSGIETAVKPRLEKSSQPAQDELDIFGISFRLQGNKEFLTFDSDSVSDAIGRHAGSFFDFFLDEKKGGKPVGLFDALDSALRDQEKALSLNLAEAGIRLVDVVV